MIATNTRKPLGQLLTGMGVLQTGQLDLALEEQQRNNHQKLLGEILVDMRFCSEEQVTEALALGYGVPYAHITPRLADPKAVTVLPREYLEKHQILPLFLVEGILTVAVPEPANVFLLEEIGRLSGYSVQVVAATMRDIKATYLGHLAPGKSFVVEDIVEDAPPDQLTLVETAVEEFFDPEQAAGEVAVVKLVNYVIVNAVKDGAADIHIEPFESYLRVRYRIDGRLTEKMRPPQSLQAGIAGRIKMMAGLDISRRQQPQDGSIHLLMEKRPVDLRVGIIPGKWGEKVLIRLIDNDQSSVNLEKLGFGYDTLKAWRKLILSPSGVLLVTGPAACGKTTTLYAVLHEINRQDVNICTVEDPIEYAIDGINQFQVDEKSGFTYAGALRAVLRQNPDVLMAGEILDAETARIAAQAALTGHLVLSTLNTNDAASALTRLLNLGIEPYMAAAAVSGVLAQRLVRKLCPHCKEPCEASVNERKQIEKMAGTVQSPLFRSRGCARCRNLGFSGRIGLYELLIPNDQMSERIGRGAPLNEIRELAVAGGMKLLRQDGMEKVKAGITTLEEVYRVTS